MCEVKTFFQNKHVNYSFFLKRIAHVNRIYLICIKLVIVKKYV